MSDPIDTLLNEMLAAPLAGVVDDGFSNAVFVKLIEMQGRRTRTISIVLASIACVLFALVSTLALRAQPTSTATAVMLPIALSLAIGTLILSRAVQQLLQE